MKTVMLYRPNSEHERQALDYLRDFAAQTGKKLDTLDPDSREGADISRLYEVMQFPTILATDDEGHVQNMWPPDRLPTYSELSYYVVQTSALNERREHRR
jgi:hypothetical protein